MFGKTAVQLLRHFCIVIGISVLLEAFMSILVSFSYDLLVNRSSTPAGLCCSMGQENVLPQQHHINMLSDEPTENLFTSCWTDIFGVVYFHIKPGARSNRFWDSVRQKQVEDGISLSLTCNFEQESDESPCLCFLYVRACVCVLWGISHLLMIFLKLMITQSQFFTKRSSCQQFHFLSYQLMAVFEFSSRKYLSSFKLAIYDILDPFHVN